MAAEFFGSLDVDPAVSDRLHNRLQEALMNGVSPKAVDYIIGALERGAQGRRFCTVLSINGQKVWVGETPLHRTDGFE